MNFSSDRSGSVPKRSNSRPVQKSVERSGSNKRPTAYVPLHLRGPAKISPVRPLNGLAKVSPVRPVV